MGGGEEGRRREHEPAQALEIRRAMPGAAAAAAAFHLACILIMMCVCAAQGWWPISAGWLVEAFLAYCQAQTESFCLI